ncbi:MAG: GNAT family N-acetyltransferase, partial [Deltaproteobacteria bacterium]|nr:GNAT family N-acetyltransferase [Deltaproteobacteria bacterium]
MTQTFTHLRHHVAHDDLWFSIRAKHYADGKLIEVKDPSASGASETLTHLVPMPYCEKRVEGTVLTSPVSFFSPGIATADQWTPGEWRGLFKALRSYKKWTIARFTMLTDQQASILERHAAEGGLLTWSTPEKFWIISGKQTFDAYLKTRSSKFNANQRRCKRHMDTKGFTYSHDLDFDQIVKAYLSRQGHISSDKHPDDYSIRPQFHAFLKELREAYKADGRWYECGVLDDKGELAAFVLSFRDKEGVFYCFQTCHNPEY